LYAGASLNYKSIMMKSKPLSANRPLKIAATNLEKLPAGSICLAAYLKPFQGNAGNNPRSFPFYLKLSIPPATPFFLDFLLVPAPSCSVYHVRSL
jgi:hypothetical protein